MKPTGPETGTAVTRQRLRVRGRVQGVGFRPFVHRRATALRLSGFVLNTPDGVQIEVEGPSDRVAAFREALAHEPPSGAAVTNIAPLTLTPLGLETGFEIRDSDIAGSPSSLAAIPPDLATCPDCLAEIADPSSRRYRYPFTTCTACGPRYTIVGSLPFDRARTSMRLFPMCAACQSEYDDPDDRRFHAETIACTECGPRLSLWDQNANTLASGDDALRQTADLLRAGAIVAVKALGGFQLMVDARNEEAVRLLRERKHRPDKPFAVMFPDIASIAAEADVGPVERALLEASARPIVLLTSCRGMRTLAVAPAVVHATGLLGAMLPSTPLHHLLLAELGFPVVATSGNLSGEPIATDEREAAARLRGVADAFLVHGRLVRRPVDDSVVRVIAGRPTLIRRARGYTPLPVPADVPAGILALGAHMKAAVAVSLGAAGVILSQHIGDLDSAETEQAFAHAVADLRTLSGTTVRTVAHDLHPDYASTRLAHALNLPVLAVQHHAAHVAAVIAEHRLALPVLGVAWDGTGLGSDGTNWGGEFVRVTDDGWHRVAHLAPMRLPGGDKAAREPRRAAAAVLHATFGSGSAEMADLAAVAAFTATERGVMTAMIEKGINSPLATSAGRLFDAVAALLGLVQTATYEGQAATALEAIADDDQASGYRFDLRPTDAGPLELDWRPAIAAIVDDIRAGVLAARIASAFHTGLAEAIAATVDRLGDRTVALAGGCFQNRRLTEHTIAALSAGGRRVFWPEAVPANDGGIALGQVWWAAPTVGGA